MESFIVHLDFSADFDRVSHRGLVFKFKSIGVGGSVLSICTEFFSDHKQRVVVDGAVSEWIPIISGMPHGSVLGPLLFILYTREMFELVRTHYLPMQMTPNYSLATPIPIIGFIRFNFSPISNELSKASTR